MSRTKFLAFGILALASLMAASSFIILFHENNSGFRTPRPTLVACVGDSITQYSGYPEALQAMLGNRYIVGNFGVSSTTALANSNMPYKEQQAFLKAKLFSPDFVVIMLGTNDAKSVNYASVQNFNSDYETLIGEFQNLTSKPRLVILIPPPVFSNQIDANGTNLEIGIIPRIQRITADLNLPTINFYSLFIDHPDYFPDGVHPNSEGANIIAREIKEFVTSH